MDIIEVASILAQGSPVAVILLLLLIIFGLVTGKVVTKGQLDDCKERCSHYEKRADKYERLFIATNVVNDRLLEIVED